MNEFVAQAWLTHCFPVCKSLSDLANGKILFFILSELEPDLFCSQDFADELSLLENQHNRASVEHTAFLRRLMLTILVFLSKVLNHQAVSMLLSVDISDPTDKMLLKLVEVLLLVGVNCANKHKVLDGIATMNEQHQQQLMFAMSRLCLDSSDSASEIKILISEKAALEDKVSLETELSSLFCLFFLLLEL
jgi:hypothetical protein